MPTQHQWSYIKNIYIPVFKYKFDHGPTDREKSNPYFTGREDIKRRLQLLFKNADSDHGAYLVTGYRGMGKTSLVREAFNEKVASGKTFKQENKIKTFNFSLSQDEVTDMDLLRQIAAAVIDYWKEHYQHNRYQIRASFISNIISLFLALYIPLIVLSSQYTFFGFNGNAFLHFWEAAPIEIFGRESTGLNFFFFGLVAVFYLGISRFLKRAQSVLLDKIDPTLKHVTSIKNKMDILEKRLFSKTTQEDKDFRSIDLDSNSPGSCCQQTLLRQCRRIG
ncbi:MAG: ATP-binding protein [Lewinellaceae bacterium]|nr:ATP-binding protein [Lewinellaceae bacterium]